MPAEITVFISSKMVELKEERERIQNFLPTLNNDRYTLKAWIYEIDAPATSKSIREVYLDALKESQLYIGLFWNEYGEWTIDEFEKAGEWGIPRHIYVKDAETDQSDPRLETFLAESQGVISGESHKWFKTLDDLETAIEQGIVAWAEEALFHHPGSLNALIAKDADDIPNHVAPRNFIGRTDTRQKVMAELTAQEQVLLQGFGGMGKTALAGTLAIDWLENGQGNVVWLTAGSENTDTLFEAIARPLDAVQDLYAVPENERPQFVKQLLKRTQATLLVIDDVWNGKHLQTLLNAVPRSMAVLITSRLRLPIDVIVEIGEMPPFEAIDLLGHYARQSYHGNVNAEALCELLGYHAYALEIAGSTLKSTKQQPEDLHSQIEPSPDTLRMPHNFVAQGRENVGKLIDISLKGLDVISRETFMAFGAMFVPSATSELLSLYSERKESMIQQALNQLVGRGLVNVVEETVDVVEFYRVHALTHSYARAYIVDEHHQGALNGCFTYTEKYNEPSRENFRALEPEIPNFLGAVSHAMIVAQWQVVSDLSFNLYGHSQVLDYRGYYEQAIELLQHGAQASQKLGNRHNEGAHLGNLGLAYANLGQYDKAIDHHTRALAISREIGNRHLECRGLGSLGNAYDSLGKYNKAIDYHIQALAISREIGNRHLESSRLGSLGSVYANLGQYDKADDYYEQALTISRRSHFLPLDQYKAVDYLDRILTDTHRYAQGNLFLRLGLYDKAIHYIEQSLAISRDIGNRNRVSSRLSGLGIAYSGLGQYDTAIDYFEQALAISREIGDLHNEGSHLGNLGLAYYRLGLYNKAIDHHNQSLVIAREIGNRSSEGNALGNLGLAYANLGQYDKAVGYYEQTIKVFVDLRMPHMIRQVDRQFKKYNINQANQARMLWRKLKTRISWKK